METLDNVATYIVPMGDIAPLAKRVKINATDIEAKAQALFPEHLPFYEYNRQAWLRAIAYLRTKSSAGWVLDKFAVKR